MDLNNSKLPTKHQGVFDVAYIGAGPSTIFSVLHLLESNKNLKILILEKGHSIELRNRKTDVVYGFGGAGLYSDSKLSSDLYTTGGQLITKMSEKEYTEYEDLILKRFSELLGEKDLKWDQTTKVDFPGRSGLNWLAHNTLHLGTERGMEAMLKAEHIIQENPNVDLIFDSEVTDINWLGEKAEDKVFQIVTNDKYCGLLAKKVVIATGQKGKISADIMSKFGLKTVPRPVNIGIRVKDVFHEKYQKLSKANYDFKISKTYLFTDPDDTSKKVSVRLRTFCVNSGNAHVCEEKIKEYGKEYSAFNGHAFKTGDATGFINYGIIAEVEGLGPDWNSKEAQTQRMWEINQYPEWKTDNLNEDGTVKFKGRNLLEDFEDITQKSMLPNDSILCYNPALAEVYPRAVIWAYADFVHQLDRVIGLREATYYYPEVKPAGVRPDLTQDYEVKEIPGLYMCGDADSTRGITKSSITGLIIAKAILK